MPYFSGNVKMIMLHLHKTDYKIQRLIHVHMFGHTLQEFMGFAAAKNGRKRLKNGRNREFAAVFLSAR
jgi:hypothetical protein